MQIIKGNWWKVLIGLFVIVFVAFAISKLTKGMRLANQQTGFIGGPSIGKPDNQKQDTQNQAKQKFGRELSFLPACPQGKELFTVFPLKESDYDSITPLGNLNPTGHTFPTDHLYVQVSGLEKYGYESGNPANRKALLAPTDMYITKIAKSEEIGGIADYAIEFSPCRDALGKFGHVGSLSPKIKDEIAKINTKCDEYSTGGNNYKNCEYPSLKIQVKAGEEIGGAGDGRSAMLDIWMSDYREPQIKRANPSRWDAGRNYVSCFLDYYPITQNDTFYDLLRGPNGDKRTKEPRCGTVEVDVAGTAQGVWFYNLQGQIQQEDEHLALAWDNIQTDKQVFSVGTAGQNGGVKSGAYSFVPKTDGQVDHDFSQVSADGNVYCYDTANINQQGAKKAILLTMPSAQKLRLKSAPTATCGAGPWTLDDGFVEYDR